jgi:hypothetical protein
MNGKQLGGRTITVELSGRPPKDGEGGRAPPKRDYDDRADTRGAFAGAGGGNSRSMGSSDVATRNLFVANIPPETSEGEVQAHFSKYGAVLGVKFLPKKLDTIAAFVDFQNLEDARDAHEAVNTICGIKVRTGYKAHAPPPPGCGEPRGGYPPDGPRGGYPPDGPRGGYPPDGPRGGYPPDGPRGGYPPDGPRGGYPPDGPRGGYPPDGPRGGYPPDGPRGGYPPDGPGPRARERMPPYGPPADGPTPNRPPPMDMDMDVRGDPRRPPPGGGGVAP